MATNPAGGVPPLPLDLRRRLLAGRRLLTEPLLAEGWQLACLAARAPKFDVGGDRRLRQQLAGRLSERAASVRRFAQLIELEAHAFGPLGAVPGARSWGRHDPPVGVSDFVAKLLIARAVRRGEDEQDAIRRLLLLRDDLKYAAQRDEAAAQSVAGGGLTDARIDLRAEQFVLNLMGVWRYHTQRPASASTGSAFVALCLELDMRGPQLGLTLKRVRRVITAARAGRRARVPNLRPAAQS